MRIHNAAWGAANFIHRGRHEDTKPSQALIDAMASVKSETLPGSVLLAKSLLPVFGNYTVADAVYMVGMLRTIGFEMQPDRGIDSEDGEPLTADDLLHEVVWLLEHFICTADASNEECASARAVFMAKAQEDDAWKPADHFMAKLADCAMDDLRCLRRLMFGSGETFGSPFRSDRIEGQSWLFKVVRAEEGEETAFALLRAAGDVELKAVE
ncbi:hypothetical protein [Reyranella soli]|uniref:hypothetical protein n=1 Tax=Reyranella soli TaxID=1230389 RepID=UPI0014788D6B|nr:hypothetical protein [Reyranella soli]